MRHDNDSELYSAVVYSGVYSGVYSDVQWKGKLCRGSGAGGVQ